MIPLYEVVSNNTGLFWEDRNNTHKLSRKYGEHSALICCPDVLIGMFSFSTSSSLLCVLSFYGIVLYFDYESSSGLPRTISVKKKYYCLTKLHCGFLAFIQVCVLKSYYKSILSKILQFCFVYFQ